MNHESEGTSLSVLPNSATLLERFAVKATQHIGSLPSLLLHSFFFVGIFGLQWFGFSFDKIMLLLTTVVSLEAIYLSIFIQMTINRQARQIEEVSEDVEDIQDNVVEISKDIDEIHEDVEDLSEEFEKDDVVDAAERSADQEQITKIEHVLKELLHEIKSLKQ